MTIEDIAAIVAACHFPEYKFDVWEDSRGAMYLQGQYEEAGMVF